MAAFLSNYSLWMVLGTIFVATHLFGMGCGGAHGHSSQRPKRNEEEHAAHGTPGCAEAGRAPRRQGARACHSLGEDPCLWRSSLVGAVTRA